MVPAVRIGYLSKTLGPTLGVQGRRRALARCTGDFSSSTAFTSDHADPLRLTTKAVQVALLFLFSVNGFADRSRTAASTTARILTTVQIASSKPHTTAPTKPSKRLSMYSPPHDIAAYCWAVLVDDFQGKNLIAVR